MKYNTRVLYFIHRDGLYMEIVLYVGVCLYVEKGRSVFAHGAVDGQSSGESDHDHQFSTFFTFSAFSHLYGFPESGPAIGSPSAVVRSTSAMAGS